MAVPFNQRGYSFNPNKLFARLSIRAKLGIAFSVLAIVPLAVIAALTIKATVDYLSDAANLTLAHDVETTRANVQRSLYRTERDVVYFAEEIVGPLVRKGSLAEVTGMRNTVARFMRHAPTLISLKVIDPFGRVLVETPAYGHDPNRSGMFYAVQAATVSADQHLILPVELRGRDGADDELRLVPAIAILIPVFFESGAYAGVVVGEAYAQLIFGDIEISSPSLDAVTGLVLPDGTLLYHSELKADWTSLMAEQPNSLQEAFDPFVVDRILSGGLGTLETADGRIVSYAGLDLDEAGINEIVLYRMLPKSALYAPILRFRARVIMTALMIIPVVLGLAYLGSRQLTKPIYELRKGFDRLRAGQKVEPLRIDTNDEFEDLASEFYRTATTLEEHRNELETLVQRRTADLRRASAELQDMLANSADAIVGLDTKGRVRIWNRGAEGLFGYSESDTLGKSIGEILPPPDPADHLEETYIQEELLRSGSVVNLRTTRPAKSGESIPVRMTQTVIGDASDGSSRTSIIFRDVRPQERLEQQLRRSERIAAVSVMAAGLAHEINNPLAIIGNRLEVMEHELRHSGIVADLAPDLKVLTEHTDRLRSVTRDLLRFARDYDDSPRPIDLGNVSSRVSGMLERSFGARGIEIDIAGNGVTGAVLASEPAMETVLMNLLLNARDAMPEGGTIWVQIARSAPQNAVQVSVRDSGIGIPEAIRHKVFEPFFSTKAEGAGMGLGLALCRSIIERHRGRIWVASSGPDGTEMMLELPVDGVAGGSEPEDQPEGEAG